MGRVWSAMRTVWRIMLVALVFALPIAWVVYSYLRHAGEPGRNRPSDQWP